MSGDLTAALEHVQQDPERRTVADLIEAMRPEVERSLQSADAAAILTRHYFNAVRYNPLLLQCTARSLVAALLLSAQVRLEPGPLGHVYLVPFRDGQTGEYNVVWMLGYTGIVELARRGGAAGLRASVVWDCDAYVAPWENEKGQHWTLRPGPVADRGERVGALVTWRDGSERMALDMPPARVDAAVKASRNPRAAELRNDDWYWRKTAVRFARPWLPLTTGADFARAAAADGGIVRTIDVEDATAIPVVDAPEEATNA